MWRLLKLGSIPSGHFRNYTYELVTRYIDVYGECSFKVKAGLGLLQVSPLYLRCYLGAPGLLWRLMPGLLLLKKSGCHCLLAHCAYWAWSFQKPRTSTWRRRPPGHCTSQWGCAIWREATNMCLDGTGHLACMGSCTDNLVDYTYLSERSETNT